MTPSRSHLSPPYPVLYSLSAAAPSPDPGPWVGQGMVELSLGLLIRGIPSFLATIPVDGELVEGITESLDAGDAQVAVAGISVSPDEVDGQGDAMGEAGTGDPTGSAPGGGPKEAWMASAGTPAPDLFHVPTPLDGDPPSARGRRRSGGGGNGRSLPAAYLSLLCRDGRRLGVARIVSRDPRATPDDVARFVLEKITSGVQVPDLASAG